MRRYKVTYFIYFGDNLLLKTTLLNYQNLFNPTNQSHNTIV